MTSSPTATHRPSFAFMTVLLFCSSMTVMSGATIAPSLPGLRDHFADVPNAELLARLVLTLPALFIALTAPLVGFIIDRFGRRPPLLCALVLYAAAGSTGLYLDTLTGIIVGRIFLGVAVAGIMTTAVTLAADFFHGEERHRFMGVQTAFMGYGGVVFVMTGGLLADLHWRAPFAVYLMSLALFPAVYALISEPPRDHATHAAGEAAMVPALPRGQRAGVILLVYTIAFYGMAVFYLIPVQLPFHLHDIADLSNTGVGFAIAWNSLVAASTALFYRRIRGRFSHPAIVGGMLILMGLGYVFVGLSQSFAGVIASLTLSGLGFGVMMPNLNVWLARVAPPRMRGRLVGGLSACAFAGQFASPVMVHPLAMEAGLGGAFLAIGGLSAALGVPFFMIGRRRERRRVRDKQMT